MALLILHAKGVRDPIEIECSKVEVEGSAAQGTREWLVLTQDAGEVKFRLSEVIGYHWQESEDLVAKLPQGQRQALSEVL